MLGKVDFIVTDSPLLLNVVYDKQNDENFRKFIYSRIHLLDSLDFFINRTDKFSEIGRMHNLEQSKEIDKIVKNLAKQYDIQLIEVEQENSVEQILKIVLDKS